MPSTRRFLPPWSVDETEPYFIVRDANRQAVAYVYCEDEAGRRTTAKLLTRDEARRIAANKAKLPELLASNQGQNMKRFAAMMGASALIAVLLSTPMARKAFSDAHTEDVKHLISVNNINPTGVQIRGGPVFRNRMAAWLRWILGWITPPISPRLLG